MFLLSFIPDAWIALAVHIIFGLGIIGIIVGTVLKHIPFVNSYGKIIRAVSIVLFVSGLYFEGGIGVKLKMLLRRELYLILIDINDGQPSVVPYTHYYFEG